MDVTITVNGEEKSASVPPETTLLRMLRDDLNLTGAKLGCDVGDRGDGVGRLAFVVGGYS